MTQENILNSSLDRLIEILHADSDFGIILYSNFSEEDRTKLRMLLHSSNKASYDRLKYEIFEQLYAVECRKIINGEK